MWQYTNIDLINLIKVQSCWV